MSDPIQLSKRERQIMDAIYLHGEATATQVLGAMPNPPMRGALRTLLRILEQKGHLIRREENGEIVFRPTQPRGRAGRSALGRVLDVFFEGSLEKAVAAHLTDPNRAGKLGRDEIERLSNLIEQAKKKGA